MYIAVHKVYIPPIVHSELAVNSPLTNRNTKHDLPTPVSPVHNVCTYIEKYTTIIMLQLTHTYPIELP